jgi:hypothetical protein
MTALSPKYWEGGSDEISQGFIVTRTMNEYSFINEGDKEREAVSKKFNDCPHA